MASYSWQIDARTRHTMRTLYMEITWSGVANGIYGSFLAIFALRMGASAFQVSLLTTGPAVAGIIFPLLAARLVSRRWGKTVIVLPLAIWRLVFAVAVIAPWMPAQGRVLVLVAGVTLLSVSLAYFNTAFTPLMGKLLPVDMRAHVVGVRSTLSGVTSTLAVLAGGKVLDAYPFPQNFQILFALGFATAQVSTFLVGRLHIPALNEQRAPPSRVPETTAARPVAPKRRPRMPVFWVHTASAVVFILGVYLPIAFYPIVLVHRLHATNGWIGAIGMAGGLASIVLSPLWGRAAIRYGNRTVLVVSAVAYAVVPLGASVVPNVVAYIGVAVASGGLMAGINLGLFQCLLDVAPQSQQTRYTALYAMVVNSAVAGGPLLGTLLLASAGMMATFWLAAGCVVLGGMLLHLANPARRVPADGGTLSS